MIWQLVDSSSVGGIESHVAALTEALRLRGREARIVLLRRYGDNPWLAQLAASGLDYQILSGGFADLRAALARDRPAILHTHGYKAGIMGRLAARTVAIPVVSTFHAGERGAFPVSLYQTLDAWSAWLGASVAVNAEIARKLPFGGNVIRNFISSPMVATGAASARIVGFVGRLSPEKGPDLFCKIAERADPSIPFHIFGDGPMRSALEAQYGTRVCFRGLQADMGRVWPEIGLLLMPSRAEGMPMAALEALSRGIPVAAARVGALPDLITDDETGWLFDTSDDAHAEGIVGRWAAMSQGSRRIMADECRRLAETRFGSAEPVTQLLALYDRLAPCLLQAA